MSRKGQVEPRAQYLTHVKLQDEEVIKRDALVRGRGAGGKGRARSNRDLDVQAQIQVLNNDYNATGIQFRLIKATRIESKEWFVDVYLGSPQDQAILYNFDDASAVNVYTLTFNSTTASLRTASIASAYYCNAKSDGVMIRSSTATNV